MTVQNQEPDITLRLLWDEELKRWAWKADVMGREGSRHNRDVLAAGFSNLCAMLDVVLYTPPGGTKMTTSCEGCADQPMPGVLFPVSPDGDTTLPWVARCDSCERYESDYVAAVALALHLKRNVGMVSQYPDSSSQPFLYPIDKREP